MDNSTSSAVMSIGQRTVPTNPNAIIGNILPKPVKPFFIAKVILSLALVVTLGLVGRLGYLHYRMNWGVVVPGQIYRSAQIPAPLVLDQLRANHIGTIIYLSDEDSANSDQQAEQNAAAETGAQFLNFPMYGDGVSEPKQYPRALAAIHDAIQRHVPVLVHCHSGSQRTGGVVAMYRLLFEHASPQDAYAEMRRYGYNPARNKTLLPFLNQHIDEWAAELYAQGIIDRIPVPMPRLTIP